MLQKEYFPSFFIFLAISLALLLSGLIFTAYGINRLYLVHKLNTYSHTEKATIVSINSRNRAIENLITFSLNKNDQIYSIHLLKVLSDIHINDSVEILFNEKYDFFIIKQYKNASLFGYIILIILSITCIFLSRITFILVIDIFHAMCGIKYETK